MNIEQNTSKTARKTYARAAFAFGASFVVAAGTMTAASAAHPVDGPASGHSSSTHAAMADGTASSPCFNVRTPDRWAPDAGPQPRCSHNYGGSDSLGIEARSQRGPSAVDSPCFMKSRDWNVAFDGGIPVCTAW